MATAQRILTGLILLVTTLPVAAAADPGPPELRKLHALLLLDTNAENLTESIKVDGIRMENLLRGGVPKDRLALTVLDGNDVTDEKIANYYKQLKAGPSDCVLCYYDGHGATDPEQGHYLALTNTGPFFRSKLRSLMYAHKPGLAVILTDCCSACVRVDVKRNVMAIPGVAKQLDPALRSLFFRHHGMVDITGAMGNVAYGNNDVGGVFTASLDKVIHKHSALAGSGRENFVTWKDMYPQVERETEVTYMHWVKGDDPNNKEFAQKTQKPQAFELPDDPTRPYLILHNNTNAIVRYRCRWGSEGTWSTATLPPEGDRLHSVPPSITSADQWFLDVKFDDGETGKLKVGKTYGYSPGSKKSCGLDDEAERP